MPASMSLAVGLAPFVIRCSHVSADSILIDIGEHRHNEVVTKILYSGRRSPGAETVQGCRRSSGCVIACLFIRSNSVSMYRTISQ